MLIGYQISNLIAAKALHKVLIDAKAHKNYLSRILCNYSPVVRDLAYDYYEANKKHSEKRTYGSTGFSFKGTSTKSYDAQELYNQGIKDGTNGKSKAAFSLNEGPSSPYNRGYKKGSESKKLLDKQLYKLATTMRELGLPFNPSNVELAKRLQ